MLLFPSLPPDTGDTTSCWLTSIYHDILNERVFNVPFNVLLSYIEAGTSEGMK